MHINVNGRNIEVRGERVIVDGKEVSSGTRNGAGAPESAESTEMRSSLEKRYPNVTFKGDCSKIKIESGVTLEGGVIIEQNDNAVIEITGKSTLAEGVYVSTPKSQGNSLNSISMSGHGISITSYGGVSMHSNDASDAPGVRINNTNIGCHAEISGLAVILTNCDISTKCRLIGQGSGKIEINEGKILGNIVLAGSGDITVEESQIASTLNLSGSGDMDIRNSSTVSAPISLAGSGNIVVSSSNVLVSAPLSVTGSGSIKAKNCTVSKPYGVVGSKDIRVAE